MASTSHPDSPPKTPEQTHNHDTQLPGTQKPNKVHALLSEDGSSSPVVISSPNTANGGMEPARRPNEGASQEQVQVPSTPRPGQNAKLERTPSQTQRKLAFPRTQPNHVI